MKSSVKVEIDHDSLRLITISYSNYANFSLFFNLCGKGLGSVQVASVKEVLQCLVEPRRVKKNN